VRRPGLLPCALVLALAIAGGATAASGADPGIAGGTIRLGGTAPLSGPASADVSVARGAAAYFKYVNARGGVNGRTIAYTYLDDGSDPARTVVQTRRLVEQDEVFAIVNSVGSEQSLATRDYLNQLKVPQLFVASGATTFGRDFGTYPATIGFRPSYRAEGWIYGRYLARTKPGARIAVLFGGDDDGRELLAGLEQGIARARAKVIARQAYDASASDVQAQLAALRASGADVLALFAAPRYTIEAYAFARRAGWRPLVVTSADSSAPSVLRSAGEGGRNEMVEGSISIAFLKDPTDARWRQDAALRLYRTIMSRYAKGASVDDVRHVYGMAVAYETVRVLEAEGKNPTRAGVTKRLARLRDASNPFLLPGISVRTGATERFPLEQAQLRRWSKGRWRSFGGLWSHPSGGSDRSE
jgi:branched-chain amino acid transport system substrate-binding protein